MDTLKRVIWRYQHIKLKDRNPIWKDTGSIRYGARSKVRKPKLIPYSRFGVVTCKAASSISDQEPQKISQGWRGNWNGVFPQRTSISAILWSWPRHWWPSPTHTFQLSWRILKPSVPKMTLMWPIPKRIISMRPSRNINEYDTNMHMICNLIVSRTYEKLQEKTALDKTSQVVKSIRDPIGYLRSSRSSSFPINPYSTQFGIYAWQLSDWKIPPNMQAKTGPIS